MDSMRLLFVILHGVGGLCETTAGWVNMAAGTEPAKADLSYEIIFDKRFDFAGICQQSTSLSVHRYRGLQIKMAVPLA